MKPWSLAIKAAGAVAIVAAATAGAVGGFLRARRGPVVELHVERVVTAATAAPDAFVFVGGAGSGGRVTRTHTDDGGETLHGETDVPLGAQAHRHIVEDVRLDARGWLVSADVRVDGEAGSAGTRLVLTPGYGTVRVETPAGADVWMAPADAPWVYAAPGVGAEDIATPVAAWVALRAASASPSVRQIERAGRRAWLVPRDQIAVETEIGTTVVLGSDGVDVDGIFVERVRSAAYGTTFVRAPRPPRNAI